MKKRKKPWLAGLMNLLVPGLGYFYLEKKVKGYFWMIMGVAMLCILKQLYSFDEPFYDLSLTILLSRWTLLILYPVLIIKTSQNAVGNTYEYNARLSLQEKIEFKKQLKEKGLRG